VRLLWEVCQVPDFRKLADDTHSRLCARIFGHLVRDGTLPADWLAGQIAAISRADGDIDTLMQRLAGVRVWSYIAARADWVADSPHWQAMARAVEDQLSDALHARLTARFVDRRAAVLMRRLDEGGSAALLSAVTRAGQVVVEGHPVGRIAGFGFLPDPESGGEARRLVLRAARRALGQEMPRRVAALEAAADTAFTLAPVSGAALGVLWDGAAVARLRPGAAALRPLVEIADSEFLDGAQRERLRQRLQRFVDDRIARDLAPLFALADAARREPALRGVAHRLAEALGVAPAVEPLDPRLRARLKSLGVRAGRHALFLPALLKPRPAALRAALLALPAGAAPALPPAGAVALAPPEGWPEGFAFALGWLPAGPVLLRLDVAEQVTAELEWAGRRHPVPLPAGLASRLSVKQDLVPAVLRRLGFRLFPSAPLPGGQCGPPAPAMLAPQRRHAARAEPPPAARGPFAALAALRR
jgi:ATP-dependent RNA helicase SUPV3L1/SUV3